MAGTLNLHIYTGANAATDGGSANSFSYLSADSAGNTAADRTNNPITIPSSGCAWSYEKWIAGCVSVAPTTAFRNFQVWGTPPAQTWPAGTCVHFGTVAWAAGSAPTSTATSIATKELKSATSAAASVWDSSSYHDAASITAYVVLQLQITTTACVGAFGSGGCALSYSYDEL